MSVGRQNPLVRYCRSGAVLSIRLFHPRGQAHRDNEKIFHTRWIISPINGSY